MEIVIESEEVEELLRKALKSEKGLETQGLKMVIRCNHKIGTVKVVFSTPIKGP